MAASSRALSSPSARIMRGSTAARWPSSASIRSPCGRSRSNSAARPLSVSIPRPAAAAPSSLNRRDLPIPGSPVTARIRAAPAHPASSTVAPRSSSAPRPTIASAAAVCGPVMRRYQPRPARRLSAVLVRELLPEPVARLGEVKRLEGD
jgi:hypothetical protein